jgi:hypothetical protein
MPGGGIDTHLVARVGLGWAPAGSAPLPERARRLCQPRRAPRLRVSRRLFGPTPRPQGDRASLPWCCRIRCAAQAGAALSHLHAQDPPVVHRDVKARARTQGDVGRPDAPCATLRIGRAPPLPCRRRAARHTGPPCLAAPELPCHCLRSTEPLGAPSPTTTHPPSPPTFWWTAR